MGREQSVIILSSSWMVKMMMGTLKFASYGSQTKQKMHYVEQAMEDIRSVPVTSVKLVLPKHISVPCHTKRMVGIKRFDVNLECYNMK